MSSLMNKGVERFNVSRSADGIDIFIIQALLFLNTDRSVPMCVYHMTCQT